MSRKDRLKKQRKKAEARVESMGDEVHDEVPGFKVSRNGTFFRNERFDVTTEPMDWDGPPLSAEMRARIDAVADALRMTNPAFLIDEIRDLMRQAPRVPVLHNFLSVALLSLGRADDAFVLTHATTVRFPDYVFGLSNLASMCVQRKRVADVPQRFRAAGDLAALVPSRRLFHYTELVAFEAAKGMVACAEQDFRRARIHLALAEKFSPATPDVRLLRSTIARGTARNAAGEVANPICRRTGES